MAKKQKIKKHDKIMTPDGIIEVQVICYDTKTGKYSYSIFGPKSKYYSEEEVTLLKEEDIGAK